MIAPPVFPNAPEMAELRRDYQRYHSALQMDAFITSRAGAYHPYGMYCQSLREVTMREDRQRDTKWQIEEMILVITELEGKIRHRTWLYLWWPGMGRKVARLWIELGRARLKRARLVELEEDQLREFNHFYAQAMELRVLVGPIRGEEHRRELDEDFWCQSLTLKLAIDIFRDGKPSQTIIEVLPTLPESMRRRLWHSATHPGEAMAWLRRLAPADDVASLAGPRINGCAGWARRNGTP